MDLKFNPEFLVYTLVLLGTGWYGGGSSALHDHTDAISNGGPLGVNTVGTGQVRTATGSFASASAAVVNMNDFVFFPSISNTAGQMTVAASGPTIDPANTVGVFYIITTAGISNVHWRYLTASDRPTIWLVIDSVTHQVVAAWCSDDPVPGDLPGMLVTGFPAAVKIAVEDLAALNLPAGSLAVADAYIEANRLSPANRFYRALQEHTGEPAPAAWLLKNCQLDAGGKLALSVAGKIEIATPEPLATLSRLARIWQGITDWFIP